MSESLQIGFVPFDLSRSVIEELESDGFDSLWTGGHIASRNPGPEAMVGLTRLAALTERVRIGTSILLLPLYPPAIVAKQLADIDRMTDGRLTVGVGVGGEYPQEFRACQVPIAERGRRTNEAIPLLRSLWSGDEITHAGEFYSMEDVRLHPAPSQVGGPPIAVAGRKMPAMRRAAQLGNGWMPYLFSPQRYASSVETIRAQAALVGRDLTDFEWFAFVFIYVDNDRDVARTEAAKYLGGNYNQDFDEVLDRVAVVGTPSEVVQKLQAFVDAGARHLVFTAATKGDSREMRKLLLGEVLPQLRMPENQSSDAA